MTIYDKIIGWFWAMCLLVGSSLQVTVNAAGFACLFALILVGVDFISGVLASKYQDKKIPIKVRSRKARWSFAKLFVYVSVIAFTTFVGVGLHVFEILLRQTDPEILHGIGMADDKLLTDINILYYTLYVIKVMAWVICWIETVSVVENLRRIWPDNLFLEYLHFIIAVEIINRIPKFAKFLKEKDEKNLVCEEFDDEQKTDN